jgi:ABC-2 type transport system permease protein
MTASIRPLGSDPGPGSGRAGYREAVWSEWVKFRTVRSTVVLAALAGLALPVFAVVVAVTGSLQPDDTVLGASLLGGAALAQVLAAVLGAVLVTGELRSGMIRTTLAACPRRLVVLGAKSTVAGLVVAAVTLPAAVAAHRIGLALLDDDRYAGDPFPAILGVTLALSSLAVLGVGVGTIVRQPAGAVATVIGVVVLPGLLAPLLGPVRPWLGGASLGGVLQKLTQSSDATPDAVGRLGAWPSLAVVLAYTVGTLLGAVWVLRHRDA